LFSKNRRLNLVTQLSLLFVLATILPSKTFTVQANPSNQTLIGNADNSSDNRTSNNQNASNEARKLNAAESKLDPLQLDGDSASSEHLSNPQIVEKELTTLTPDEIKKYPLASVAQGELVIVLKNISVPTLEKTFENIPASDLIQIFDKIPQDKSQEIIDRLPQDKSQKVLDRMTSESLK
jgi:hypothetical protein